jgi:glycosyltransferase involved in cell wall biosynthesis
MTRVLVGIPAYNAERSILEVLRRVHAQPVDGIVVVDDGSADRTAEILRSLDFVQPLFHGQNKGYGAAQKTIFEYFRQWAGSERDILVFVHADGEMLPEEIPVLAAPFHRDPLTEVVFGSRMLMQANKEKKSSGHVDRPAWKVILDSIATYGQNLAYRASLSTYFGGFRAVRASVLDRLDYGACNDKHFFDQELLVKMIVNGVSITEVPVSNVENGSVSNYSLGLNAGHIVASPCRYTLRRLVDGSGRRAAPRPDKSHGRLSIGD